jgi:large subunit ribosomal protein L22
MTVKARAKFIRMSPRKVRYVVDLVRGLDVQEARHQLMFSKKAASKPVLKVLESALANATNTHKLDVSNFIVSAAMVDEGPTMHRFRPRAHGRASAIRKRMSHIQIEIGPGGKGDRVVEDSSGQDEKKAEKKDEAKQVKAKAEMKETKEKKPAAKKKKTSTETKK